MWGVERESIFMFGPRRHRYQGYQIGHFMANFEKFGYFWNMLAMKKKRLAILYNLAIFSFCHCKMKFTWNILYFSILFMSL